MSFSSISFLVFFNSYSFCLNYVSSSDTLSSFSFSN